MAPPQVLTLHGRVVSASLSADPSELPRDDTLVDEALGQLDELGVRLQGSAAVRLQQGRPVVLCFATPLPLQMGEVIGAV